MLLPVLSSPHAIAVNIEIMRAFVRLREVLASNTALAAKRLELGRKLKGHDQAVAGTLASCYDSSIMQLMWRFLMLTVSVPVPETTFFAPHLAPKGLAREMRIAASIQWYAQGKISQDKAAEIAGLSRAAFIDALSAARVSSFQVTANDLATELADAH